MIEVVGDASRGGQWALVRLTVDGERIVSAEAEGLERPLEGLTLLEAAAVGGEELAVDALANALGPVFRTEPRPSRVAVAMSGGVDSAVALLRAGEDAIGVTLRLWLDPQGPATERACCSPEAVLAARATCHSLGRPHVTLDLREEFRRAVVQPFVRGYAAGETPNPCIRCNGSFRFAELLAFAERAGAGRLATGHYARVLEHEGRLLLARATDPAKDQSYMLARLDPRFLGRVWFPLGDQSKEETRAEAARAGLAAASRAESQEACFLAGGDYRDFLARHGLESAEGSLVDEDGRELGRHDGFWRFTAGQRRGLGVAAGRPLYALRSEPRTNTVVVGPREALAVREVTARGRLYAPVRRAAAKLRYRSPPLDADVSATPGGFRLRLDRPAYGVASGQAAVLYDGEVVVGAGTISAGDSAETSRPARALDSGGL
jgi:tRNA-specific 2-thiouridylase